MDWEQTNWNWNYRCNPYRLNVYPFSKHDYRFRALTWVKARMPIPKSRGQGVVTPCIVVVYTCLPGDEVGFERKKSVLMYTINYG